MEEIIFELIANGGTAKSLAYEAIHASEEDDFDKAESLLEEGHDYLLKAHKAQTKLITDEMNEEPVALSLLMVHAQDHLMTALEVNDLAKILIKQNRRLASLENKIQQNH